MRIDGMAALRMLRGEERARYPNGSDPRARDGAIFPEIRPSVSFAPDSRVFTTGSCFARNIEEHLGCPGSPFPRQGADQRGESR